MEPQEVTRHWRRFCPRVFTKPGDCELHFLGPERTWWTEIKDSPAIKQVSQKAPLQEEDEPVPLYPHTSEELQEELL